LQRAAEVLMGRQAEIAGLITAETGGTRFWGMYNDTRGPERPPYAAAQPDTSPHDEEIPSRLPGKRSMAVRQPVGVVVGIVPWNAPVILGLRAVAAPLAYGNTVVLKASEQCPRTHAAIVEAISDAGLPSGAITLVTNEREHAAEVAEELIAHPAVRRISFTGSTHVGRIIAEKAGRHLKRVLLELGGKAPLIVLADADLERAAAAASFGAFMHQGQICLSTERILVDSSVKDQLSEKLRERAIKLTMGDPNDPSTQIGPLVSDDALTRVSELLQDAVVKGAKPLCGGNAHGRCLEPTVLTDVTPEMRIYYEESFGPVVTIVPVDGPEEAVGVANDTEYGLASAVFTADIDAAMDIARRLETGVCHINDATVNDEPQMPLGGIKASGWGRFGGTAALEEFTELRWITVQESPRRYPI
jgi:benzaldehyde dehydrogenase (NAD)